MAPRASSRHRSEEHDSAAHSGGANRTRFLLALLYLAALSLLVVWEYRERLEVFSHECEFRDETKSSLYNEPYTHFLNWAATNAAGHVVTLAIPADLEEIHKNVCLGRAYMADVLLTLATKDPAVVVIDKFYGPNACASEPASTKELVAAIQSLKKPVVVGESTNQIENDSSGSCLVRKEQLDMHSPNVRYGLTRLNAELERFPLTWSIHSSAPEESEGHAHAGEKPKPSESQKLETHDSISLAAVRAYDADFVTQPAIQRLLREEQPYANLSVPLPGTTTTNLLCSAGSEAARKRWSPQCHEEGALPNMTGRIVVIGAEEASDRKTVLGKHTWGFDLQARYTEALLSGNYLRYLPLSAGFTLFAFWIFLIEGLPILLLAHFPQWQKTFLVRHAYPRRRYFWVVFCTVALLAVSTIAALAFRFLPPLLAFEDILLVAVTRLLVYLSESAEHPYLHASQPHPSGTKAPGKAHPMSQHKWNPAHPMDTSRGADPSVKAPKPVQPPGEPIAPPPPSPPPPVKPGSEGGTEG